MAPALDVDAAYRRFGEAVFRRARRLLRDETLAWDVVQETFLRAHKYQRSHQGGPVLPWLFTIADRVAFDMLRKRGVVASVDVNATNAADALAPFECGVGADVFAAAPTPPDTDADRRARDDAVALALRGVSDETRQILVHRYFDELTTAAIAARTGQSERTIRRRLEEFFSGARVRLGVNTRAARGA